jgi:hypothetical protein
MVHDMRVTSGGSRFAPSSVLLAETRCTIILYGHRMKLHKIIHVDMDAFHASVEQRDAASAPTAVGDR